MNAADLHPRKRVAVLDSEMSYVDVGEGDPIVFLHGNPTSSYLWRNIIAAVSRLGRCLAPDLRWDGFGEAAGIFRALRSPEGEQLVLDQNAFVEVVLPRGSIRTLSEEEMSVYRAPYRTREARLPTLIWPRQIPIDGEPVDVTDIVEGYGRWLAQSSIPKLFVAGDPGAIISVGGRGQAFCRSWPNQREITVRGRHFLQEDSPEEIAAAVAAFVTDVRRDEGRAPIALAEAVS